MRELLARTPVERFLERMAASIDGPAAGDLDLTINLVLTDRGESHVLQLRNGVLRHRAAPEDPSADATLRLTHAVFLDMMTGQAGAGALLTSDEVTIEGSTLDLGRFFSLVEKPPGNFPILSR
jgi:alkyl sulfatase BDS1-like metallo-beta-lactamase superfamily hydrolase